MMNISCNVCGNTIDHILYKSPSNSSLTSLCQLYHGVTCVYACKTCGHLQTTSMDHVAEYYDQSYDILVESEDEDQIYETNNGVLTYRTEHQLKILQEKLLFPAGTRMLDYGCAKSSMMRSLLQSKLDIRGYLFDISERYLPFWEKFVGQDQWSTYTPPSEWKGYFDIVSSFFSLEHMVEPQNSLTQIVSLLKPGGIFYCVVPNVLTNIADFIVIDHINHFTPASLRHLLCNSGLHIREIDVNSHRGAIVVVAERPMDPIDLATCTDNANAVTIATTIEKLKKIGNYWQVASEKISQYEAALALGEHIAVYGAGFYGHFIAACLREPERIACFIDQNPYIQGRQINGKPVLAPGALPSQVRKVMVGLNPAHAKEIISDIACFSKQSLEYFFL